MQKNICQFYLVIKLILISILCSCSFYVSGQKAGKILETIPNGADVLDAAKKKLGTTPFDLVKLVTTIRTITIAAEGYDSTEITFPVKVKKDLEFPGSVSTCTPPCLVNFT